MGLGEIIWRIAKYSGVRQVERHPGRLSPNKRSSSVSDVAPRFNRPR